MASWWSIISSFAILGGILLFIQSPDDITGILMVSGGVIGFLTHPGNDSDQ